MNNRNKISTTLIIFSGRIFAVAVLFTIATVGTAFAGTITKSFEFGPGTPYTRSNVRTFPVLCRKPVTATVKFQTLGAAPGLVPITIELIQPDTAPDQEGPLVEAKNITARTLEQTVTLSSQGNQGINRGCSLPWRVRVKHANDGPAPFLTLGSIKLDFDSAVRNKDFHEDHYIGKGGSESLTVDLGSLSPRGELEEGIVVLKGYWFHDVAGLMGPNPIKLKFTLIDPIGTEVITAEGYSNSELRSELRKLKLTYRVTKCTPGQWKLKITNLDSGDDVRVSQIEETFTPSCP